MKLFYYPGRNGVTNFGDELNHYLWPRLLPGVFDRDDGTQFVGIGTLLNDHLPAASRTVVFGAGVGYYGPPRPDPSWEVYSVRGPLSAKALGLPLEMAVTDPAIMIAPLTKAEGPPARTWKYAFMPHWQSEPDDWLPICEAIGFGFIDPRWPPQRVIEALRGTGTLLTEAMHGAIVADALRIPWIPIRTRETIKAFKWEDWCLSMELDYRPASLPTIWPKRPDAGPVRRARRWARLKLIENMLPRIARRGRPLLSRPSVLDARLCELDHRLARLQRAHATAAAR